MSGQRPAWTSTESAAVLAVVLAACVAPVARAQDRPPAGGADVVVRALALLGTPYRYGGASPQSGFDCSGLVRHVFAAAVARELPRRTEEISAVGEPVARSDLQPGDLVFFNTLRRAYSHVAIYIGDGRFVHAPAGKGRVRIEGLEDGYWAARFNGARRVLDGRPVATAESPAPAPAPPAHESRTFPGTERPPEP
jgi:cell wall-associated NlpC family hydrolase